MTVFACKDAFLGLGIEEVKPSGALVSQDCSICTEPLAVHHNHASPKALLHGYHTAVRIIACGHMHGKECLDAWLDLGNSCPTCARILFELTGDPITQRDIDNLVRMLGPEYGEEHVYVALVGLARRQERKQAALRRVHEQEVAKQKMEDFKALDDGFLLSDEDFLDSDDQMDFGEDGDEEYLEEDGEEVYVVDDQDTEDSAT